MMRSNRLETLRANTSEKSFHYRSMEQLQKSNTQNKCETAQDSQRLL